MLVCRAFSREEVDMFSTCLHTSHRDTWVDTNGEVIRGTIGGESIIQIPTLYTSPGMRMKPFDEREPEDRHNKIVEFAWIIVVRGRGAGLFSKVRVFYSIFAGGGGRVEEALRGI